MGTDIHTYMERQQEGEWHLVPSAFRPFRNRNYSVFAFLAGVRNYSVITPISDPRGLPEDVSDSLHHKYYMFGYHSASYLTVQELLDFDYHSKCVDHRSMVQIAPNIFDGGGYSEKGVEMTYAEFLGGSFMGDLIRLEEMGIHRVVFWFDS